MYIEGQNAERKEPGKMTSKYHGIEERMRRTYTRNAQGQFAVNHELAQVKAGMDTFRLILDDFVQGDKHRAIRMLNAIRPIDVMEYILDRRLTEEEGTQYLGAIGNAPTHLQGIFRLGKIWQDLKQASRKYLQGTGTYDSLLAGYKSFLQGIETGRIRVK